MAKSEEFAKIIQDAGGVVNQYVGNNLLLNVLFLIFLIAGAFYISKKI